jgi:TetR/AcrR family transcriptional regulator
VSKPARKNRAKGRVQRRNPEATRKRLLVAAIDEFSRHGFSGGRVERIVAKARINMRMAYHYFGNKQGLYVAALEAVYADIRGNERALELDHLEPTQAIDRLVDFTIDHFAAHPEFVALTLGENILKGRFIRASKLIPKLSSPLVEQISRVLARGAEQGVTPRGVDPVAFYLSIVALACHHLNNRYTLSATFGIDVGSERWKRDYKSHAKKIIMAFVSA